jgi:hypothetical protein
LLTYLREHSKNGKFIKKELHGIVEIISVLAASTSLGLSLKQTEKELQPTIDKSEKLKSINVF